MKATYKMLLFMFVLSSCAGETEKVEVNLQEVIEEEYDTEIVEEEYFTEVLELTEEEIEFNKKRKNDSLGIEFAELTEQYDTFKGEFDLKKESFFTFVHRTFDDYSEEIQTWYFNESFELKFYDRDYGGEGGHQETEFRYFENEELGFVKYTQSDMDEPTIYFENYLDENWEVKALAYSPFSEENENYFYPTIPDRNNYKKFIDDISSDDFTFSDRFNFEDSKKVESEYGGQSSEGYSVSIDNLLFEYLYK